METIRQLSKAERHDSSPQPVRPVKVKLLLVIMALLGTSLMPAAFAAGFNAASDWLTTNGAGQVWNYGYVTGAYNNPNVTGWTLANNYKDWGTLQDWDQWNTEYSTGLRPASRRITSTGWFSYGERWQCYGEAGMVYNTMGPGTLNDTPNQFGAFRFTAPASGDYVVQTSMWDASGGTDPAYCAYVFKNTSQLWTQQAMTGLVDNGPIVAPTLTKYSYGNTVTLAAGDTLYFFTTSYAPRATGGMDIDIAPVPEPAGLALLGIGAVAALVRRRRA